VEEDEDVDWWAGRGGYDVEGEGGGEVGLDWEMGGCHLCLANLDRGDEMFLMVVILTS